MVRNILSLDGGGVMGIVSSVYLRELQRLIHLQADCERATLVDHFDLLSGTSTGSIVACGLACGYTPEKVIGLYLKKAAEIFHKPWYRFGWEWLASAKYDGQGLRETLKAHFSTEDDRELRFISPDPHMGETFDPRKHDLRKPTMVCVYDVECRRPRFFKSWRSEFQHLKVWEVCLASCSEPTYFPPVMLKIAKDSPVETPLVGGGVVANNPVAPALAEAIRINRDMNLWLKSNPDVPDLVGHAAIKREDFDYTEYLEWVIEGQRKRLSLEDLPKLVASFGTGKQTIPLDENKLGSIFSWIRGRRIIGVFMDASQDIMSYVVHKIMGKDAFFRFNPELPGKFLKMDNPEKPNLRGLYSYACDKTQEDEAALQALAGQLCPSSDEEQ
jgi:predicted acylesterase/phospholipase RssA